ncbi:MAG: metallopeptidase family protein [Bacillota bacterium]|nr:MAG: metallopeptidase family protein [Bacillota bacterium]
MRYRVRTVMSFDEFQSRLGDMLDKVPERLLDGLNGGVLADPAAKRSDDATGLLVLGQYHRDHILGRLIVLYYGSFVYLCGQDRDRWLDEMWETLRHEIRHHVEDQAGVRDLEREDQEWVRKHLSGPGD